MFYYDDYFLGYSVDAENLGENKALVIMLVKDFKLTKSSVLIPGQLIKVDQVRQK